MLNGLSNWLLAVVVVRRSWGVSSKQVAEEGELIGDSFSDYQRGEEDGTWPRKKKKRTPGFPSLMCNQTV